MRVKVYAIDKHFKGKYRRHIVAAKSLKTAQELLGMGVQETADEADISAASGHPGTIFYRNDSGEYRRRF